MNAKRQIGLLISAALHVFAMSMAVKPETLHDTPREKQSTLDVLYVDVAELAGTTVPSFDFDLEKIISRGASLFPFTSGTLEANPNHLLQNGGGTVSSTPFVMDLNSERQTLHLTEDRLQELLDKSWSRRRRWNAFEPIVAATSRYDPERGDLPVLIRGYVDQNALQPFTASWNPERKIWALLSIAADHSDFLAYISQFVMRSQSSRSSTELLFLLEKVVQANLEALTALVTLDPQTSLLWTRTVNPRAADALSALRLYYQTTLGHASLWRIDAIRRRYDEVRVGILQRLIRTTPRQYRSSDALFLLGEIYWRQGSYAEAVSAWRKMLPHSDDTHFHASSDVRQAVAGRTADFKRINAALDGDRVRWLDSSSVRLHRFGYRFDTF